ncbi:MAG: hypothetical protein LBK59_11130 [Bifidobacteriaceae bacterium]|nr:hypothetical protein [Bifidobacteriaceae bacterium]
MDTTHQIEAVNRVLSTIKRDVGDPAGWDFVRFYPHSLALGIIDAIWSVRVTSGEVVRVVSHYAAYRRDEGANPDTDTASDLLGTFTTLGLGGWIDRIGNRQRTFAALTAPEKADAVRRAAKILVDAGIETPADLSTVVARASDTERSVESAWRSIPGETSGLTWRRLSLVTGAYELPPSPWLTQYIAQAVGHATPQESQTILDEAATRLGVAPMALRQAIWHHEAMVHPSSALDSGR